MKSGAEHERVIEDLRSVIRRDGVAALAVDDLGHEDLALLAWSGSPLHIDSIAKALARAPAGEVEYLVVRAPDGAPIAKGGIEHADPHGPGKLYQLATHPELRSHGIGTHLVGALEGRIRARGIESAWLSVEVSNPRARALYERLGYEAFAEEKDGWESQDPDGRRYWKETRLTLMRRRL
jgi:ribosomal protein S18 acetylase RimI-like enzyme